ncbi:class A beta-lactamase-related serine hydrolase [Myxococcota bacterium]|nr:class A beta-lactamase-related serine hydrolase [Myxococcota bacterium]
MRLASFLLPGLLALTLTSCAPAGGSDNTDGGLDDIVTDTLNDSTEDSDHPDGNTDSGDALDVVEDTLADSSTDADADGGQTLDPTPLRDDAAAILNAYEWGEAVSNRTALAAQFSLSAYTPPPGAYLLIGKVLQGVNSPAVRWYSYGDTAFTYSPGNYWPASTVKLTAAVGALMTLSTYGLTSQAQVNFTDDDGAYSGTVETLMGDAIRISSNVAYNRLMEIAGFEAMNETYLTDQQGYPNMVLQRRYTHPYPASNLRLSPEITYSEGALSGVIPQRQGTSTYVACDNEANCITLFELLDVMRRVTLHAELPAEEHFSVTPSDITRLLSALHDAPSTMESGAQMALGANITVYNKTGLVAGDDRLDHGLIVDDTTGERYLVAVSLPYNTTTEAQLAELVREALLALSLSSESHPPIQTTQGVPLTVQMDDLGIDTGTGYRRVNLTVEAPGADSIAVWVDTWPLPAFSPTAVPDRLSLEYSFSVQGLRHLVIMAYQAGQPLSFRRLTLDIPPGN